MLSLIVFILVTFLLILGLLLYMVGKMFLSYSIEFLQIQVLTLSHNVIVFNTIRDNRIVMADY